MPLAERSATSISSAWRSYFRANQQNPGEMPWGDGYKLSFAERRAIQRSVQQFQLGESSEGRRLLNRAPARIPAPRAIRTLPKRSPSSLKRNNATARICSVSCARREYLSYRPIGWTPSSVGCAYWLVSNSRYAYWSLRKSSQCRTTAHSVEQPRHVF